MWDTRKFKAPVHTFDSLLNNYGETGCCFAQDDKLLMTGVSADRSGSGGALVIFDMDK